MALAQLPQKAEVDVRALVADARRRLEARARSELEPSLERIRRGAIAPAASAPPQAVPVPQPIPPIAPARPLRLRLRSGRTVLVAASPPVARRDDLAAIARVCAMNDRTAFHSLARHERALAELARSQEKLRADLGELQRRADVALVGLLDRLTGLGQRIEGVQRTVASASASAQAAADRGALAAELRRQAEAVRAQKVNAAVTSIQGTAFGEKGSLFGILFLLPGQTTHGEDVRVAWMVDTGVGNA